LDIRIIPIGYPKLIFGYPTPIPAGYPNIFRNVYSQILL